jgi:hypothetical protein
MSTWLPNYGSDGQGGYTYSAGDDRGTFIEKNAWRDPSPVGAIRGWMWYNKHHVDPLNPAAMAYVQQSQQGVNNLRDEQLAWLASMDQARGHSLDQLSEAQRIANGSGEFERTYQGALGSALAQIGSQYGEARRQSGFSAARSGTLGGSADIDANANINRSQGLATINAESDAENQARQSAQSQTAQFSALRQALLSGDPNSLAQMTNQAYGINQAGQGAAQQFANAQAMNQLRQQWMNTQSGYLGSALGAAGYYNTLNADAKRDGGRGVWGQPGNTSFAATGRDQGSITKGSQTSTWY